MKYIIRPRKTRKHYSISCGNDCSNNCFAKCTRLGTFCPLDR